jgi:cholesterol transport system auxiliary component
MSLARFAFLIYVALAAGCSILPKAETPRVYLLPAAPAARPAATASVAWTLRIATPTAPRALDNARIAVVPEANTISVYAGARWADSVPHLVRDRLADAFRDTGRVRAIGTDDGNLGADYELDGSLAAFQTEYIDGKPTVVIRFDAIVASTRRHQMVATRRFEVREPVDGKQVPQVVEAFGRAMDTLARELTAWTLEQAMPPGGT